MPTDAGTDADAVRVEIDTSLDDSDISNVLERVEREITRKYGNSPGFEGDKHQQDFEAALAALRIAEGRDRRASNSSARSTRVSYEVDEAAQLRKRVRRDDPGNAFGHAGTIRRDDGRHVTTSGDG